MDGLPSYAITSSVTLNELESTEDGSYPSIVAARQPYATGAVIKMAIKILNIRKSLLPAKTYSPRA